jgi:hypothetical protein
MANGNRRSYYAARIAAVLEEMRVAALTHVGRGRWHGLADLDVRHVEAYMRAGHPTLDGLSAPEFRGEVRLAVLCVEAAGPADAEALARSYAL